jgi:antitoxin ParD1/3/4
MALPALQRITKIVILRGTLTEGGMSMNISLTAELDTFVQQKVQTGMYHSASEVIREGLRLLREQDELRQARLDQLRKDVDVGINQMDQGAFIEHTASSLPALAEDIKAKGRRLLAQRTGSPR